MLLPLLQTSVAGKWSPARALRLARALPEQAVVASDSSRLEPSASRLLLLTVPVAWGTYNPALRLIYSLPHPPSPGELSGTRLLFSILPFAAALGTLAVSAGAERRAAAGGALPLAGGALATVAASVELGGYNILGTAGQAWGLAHTTAVHAAVLLSSINVFVPVIAALTGEAVRPATWVACGLVLAGISVLNTGSDGGVGSELAVSLGDVSVLASALSCECLFWASPMSPYSRVDPKLCVRRADATYTVRLGALSCSLPSYPLAAGKTAVLALGCLGWAAAEAALGWGSHPVADGSVLWGGAGEAAETRAIAFAILVFSAIIPGSYATWAQARAQSGLSATEAQVILAATPVISTLLAAALLGEPVGPNVFWAGGLVLAGSLLSTAYGQPRRPSSS